MKKTFYTHLISLITLSLSSFMALAQNMPTQEQMNAVNKCIADAGIEPPAHMSPPDAEMEMSGEKKLRRVAPNPEHKEIIDACFRENGVEPPQKRIKIAE